MKGDSDLFPQVRAHEDGIAELAERDDRIGAAAEAVLAYLRGEKVDPDVLATFSGDLGDRDEFEDVRTGPFTGTGQSIDAKRTPTATEAQEAARVVLREIERR